MINEFSNITRKNYFKFILPTIFSMFIISIYTMTDGIFVANRINSTALAAINITMPATSFIHGILFMISTGACAIIGINLGAKKLDKANQNLTNMIYALISVCFLSILVGIFFTSDIVKLLGATDSMIPYAEDYLFVQFVCTFCFVLKMFAETYLRIEGKFKLLVIGTLTGGIANIVFDYIFMYPLDMGIKGAALGSLVGALLNGLIGLYYFMSKATILKFVKAKIDFVFLKDAMVNGSSEMVTSIASGITTYLFNVILINLKGDLGVSSMSIILYLNFMLSSIFIGISMGIQPVVSYNLGAGLEDNIKKVMRLSVKLILIIGIVAFSVCNIFKYPLIHMFERENSDLITLTAGALSFFSFNFLINGFNIIGSGFFTAINNGKISAIIAFSRSLVFQITLVLLLPRFLEIDGVWLSTPFSELLCLILTLYFVKRHKAKSYKPVMYNIKNS